MSSDEVYAAVGKVIVDAAFMEWMAAQLAAALDGKDRAYAEDLCRKNLVMRELKRLAGSDTELSQLCTEISDLRGRRNELAHSIGMVCSDGRGRKIFLYFRLIRSDQAADDREDLVKYPSDILGIAREIGVVISRLTRITQERSGVSIV